MNIFSTKTDIKHQELYEANSTHYLSHEDEPENFYRKYEDDGTEYIKGDSSSRNLFDDSDIKNNYWFMVAKIYLKLHRL
jgi:hypothetical protein